ncbi:Phosphatidylinositol N-acetylglucosaminyltransferase subunit Q-GPI1 [Babesia duncani]|uniref:Phosphatidylinositol N-acetylglucosaminyltransferase subunit Q-GPI1 n=1 Tax=Babesia duncani TaxID=323732 RepID=A0AAD9PK42_9APIC|nr:Phosphatidylinositol N-acetylglucosaminyltransferase subunit Q-GPI1 [Babesia duncani]
MSDVNINDNTTKGHIICPENVPIDEELCHLQWQLNHKKSLIIASYRPQQRPELERGLHELLKRPQLSLFENLKLIQGNLKKTKYQIIRYNGEHFNILEENELLKLAPNVDLKCTCSTILVGVGIGSLLIKTTNIKPISPSRSRTPIFPIHIWLLVMYRWCLQLFSRPSFLCRILACLSKFSCMLHVQYSLVQGLCNAIHRLDSAANVLEYIEARHCLNARVCGLVLDALIGILVFVKRSWWLYWINYIRALCREKYTGIFRIGVYQFTVKIGHYCKVNSEVAALLSMTLLNNILIWSLIKPKCAEIFKMMSNIFEHASILGISSQIGFLADMATMETWHVLYTQTIMATITKWFQYYIYSLLQLFKGKKWNELKTALDSNHYTRDQLFLGTVIFTLLVILYPTIWLFYITFVLMLLPIVFAKTILKCLAELIIHNPIYFILHNLLGTSTFKQQVRIEYNRKNPTDSDCLSLVCHGFSVGVFEPLELGIRQRVWGSMPFVLLRNIARCYKIVGDSYMLI